MKNRLQHYLSYLGLLIAFIVSGFSASGEVFGAMVSATEGEKDRGTVSEHVVNGDANYLEDFVTVLGSTPTKPAADLDPKTAARIAKGTELSDGFISVFKNDWGIPSPQFQFDQLKLDLASAGDDLMNFFADKGKNGLKAWEKVIGRDYSTDIPFLEKLSEILEPSILDKLPNGEADLDIIINSLVHPHTGASHTFMKQAAEHLDDVKYLINNFDGVPGYDKVITALKNPNFFAQDGASHLLTKLKSLNPSDVAKLEGKIIDADNLDGICENCLFDIELEVSPGQFKKLELKSYSKTTVEKISTNTKFINQFKAYLADAQNFNSYEYIFNSKKATDFDLTFVKENFQSLFSKNNYEIFDQVGGAQNSLMQSLGIANKSDFIDAVSDLGDDIYKFIKVE